MKSALHTFPIGMDNLYRRSCVWSACVCVCPLLRKGMLPDSKYTGKAITDIDSDTSSCLKLNPEIYYQRRAILLKFDGLTPIDIIEMLA